jgi:hypothetical protein
MLNKVYAQEKKNKELVNPEKVIDRISTVQPDSIEMVIVHGVLFKWAVTGMKMNNRFTRWRT